MTALFQKLTPPKQQFAVQSGPTASFSEDYQAGLSSAKYTESAYSEVHVAGELLQPVIDALADVGVDLTNPAQLMIRTGLSTPGLDESGQISNYNFDFRNQLQKLNNEIKNHPELGFEAFDLEVFKTKVSDYVLNEAKEYQAYQQRSGNSGGETLGAIVSFFVNDITIDPLSFAAIGGAGNLLNVSARTIWGAMGKRALIEGLMGGGYEVFYQAGVADFRKKYGLEYSWQDFVTNVAAGATLGGLFGAGIELGVGGATQGFSTRERGLRAFARNLNEQKPSLLESDLVQDRLEMFFKELPAEAVAEGLAALQKAGVNVGYSMQASNYDIDLQATITNNPLDGTQSNIEHLDRALEATASIYEGRVPNFPEQPLSETKVASSIHHFDNLDDTIYRFNPDDVEIDAKVFQFKGGGDAFGVTGKLANETQWNPIQANLIVVYEFADGRRVVADGHQRLGLAKRILATDAKQEVNIYGNILRESDGITPQDAMVIAALKNINEGSGSAVDAAKVLRMRPEKIAEVSRVLPEAVIARDLVNLGAEAFDMVVGGVIKTNRAAVVGQLVSDPDKQVAIIKLLAKLEPTNLTETEAIVRQALETDFDSTTQINLFGTEVSLESLMLQRAAILDSALKVLKNNKAIFNNLIENRNRIQNAGNILSETENISRRDIDAQAQQILQVLASRKGPISDALTAAAKKFKESGQKTEATKDFVEYVRGAIERGELDGADVGAPGGRSNVGQENDRIAASPEKVELEQFSDPQGEGAQKQAQQLEVDARGATDIKEAMQEDVALREDLRKVVDAGATPEKINKHPAVTDALQRASQIQETHTKPGYLDDAWLQNREFDFAGEQIVGYENAIQKLYENSKILAWEDMPAAGVVLQQRKVTIIIGAPASGKSSIANKIAQAKNALIVDSDEAKKVLPEYENGVGAHAVHEESSILAGEVLVKALQNQDNIVYPRVGSNADEIDQYITKFQELGYDVDLVAVNVAPDEAYRRMIQRFINTGRLINPEYFESIGLKPMQTLNILKERVGRYAEIDNSQAIDEPKTIIQASRENPLEGVELRLRGGRETPNRLRDTATRSTVEATAAGEQRLIPGVSPITQKQRIETQIEQPLKGESAALDIGLFDEGAARQMDLTDLIPVSQQIDTETGERVLVQKTRQQIFDDIDADQKVIERFEECV